MHDMARHMCSEQDEVHREDVKEACTTGERMRQV